MVTQATALIVVVLVAASTCLAVATSAVLSTPPAPAHSAVGAIISNDQLNIYSDQQKTLCCTSIDWGEIEQGSSATHKIYIENQGSSAITLHMSASNWQPTEAGSCLTLNWNREAAVVGPDSMVEATLTLSVAWDVGSLDTFGFDIIINGIA
jgi:hypothetical protein